MQGSMVSGDKWGNGSNGSEEIILHTPFPKNLLLFNFLTHRFSKKDLI